MRSTSGVAAAGIASLLSCRLVWWLCVTLGGRLVRGLRVWSLGGLVGLLSLSRRLSLDRTLSRLRST